MWGVWAAAVLLSPPNGVVTTPEDREDVRCFIVAAEMAASEDKELEAAGSIMLFYFLGKLDGRNGMVDLENAISAEAEQMSAADKEGLLASCSAEVERRGSQLSKLAE